MRYCDCLLHHHLGRGNTQHLLVGIQAPGSGHRHHGDGEVAAGGRSVLRGKAGEAQREGKKRWRRSGATRGAVLQAGGGSLAVPQWRVAQRCLPAAWSRAAAALWGLGSWNWRKDEGNGLLGYL